MWAQLFLLAALATLVIVTASLKFPAAAAASTPPEAFYADHRSHDSACSTRRPVGFRWPYRVDSDAAKYPQPPMPVDADKAPPPPPASEGAPCAVADPTSAAPVDAVNAPLLQHPDRPYCKRGEHMAFPRDPHAIMARWRQVEDLFLACKALGTAQQPAVNTSCPKLRIR